MSGVARDSTAGGGSGGGTPPSPVAEFFDLKAHERSSWWVRVRRFFGYSRYTIRAEPRAEGPSWTLYESDNVTDALTAWTHFSSFLRRGVLTGNVALLVFTVDGRAARREVGPVKAKRQRRTG